MLVTNFWPLSVGIEQGCNEETPKAEESLMNSSSSSTVYQMVTNADGTVSLVGLDTIQLDLLLRIQGDRHYLFSSLFLLLFSLNRVFGCSSFSALVL